MVFTTWPKNMQWLKYFGTSEKFLRTSGFLLATCPGQVAEKKIWSPLLLITLALIIILMRLICTLYICGHWKLRSVSCLLARTWWPIVRTWIISVEAPLLLWWSAAGPLWKYRSLLVLTGWNKQSQTTYVKPYWLPVCLPCSNGKHF